MPASGPTDKARIRIWREAYSPPLGEAIPPDGGAVSPDELGLELSELFFFVV
ncbi:MAG: hypothetical protein ACREQ4_07960 [Candidatus Binataceae bacterium]